MKSLNRQLRFALVASLVVAALVLVAFPNPTLAAGRVENVPPPASPAWFGPSCVHIVVMGDSLSMLSFRFNISISELMTANSLTNPNLIFIGMPLRVPCTVVSQSFVFTPARVFVPSPIFVPRPFFVPSPFFMPFSFNSMFSLNAMFP